MTSKLYFIANHLLAIKNNIQTFDALSGAFLPFTTESMEKPELSVEIVNGKRPDFKGELVIYDKPKEAGQIALGVYRARNGDMMFELQEPFSSQPDGWLEMNLNGTDAKITINEEQPTSSSLKHQSTLTGALQLAFMLTTYKKNTLMIHASSVLKDGKAYLFLGKSGTGKSTHSRMWLENIPDTELLNDDHPIIRVDNEGNAIAYGSPWSGKTPCYKNLSAPIGGIVRIKRAPFNAMRRLSPVEAYASLTPSIFSTPFDKSLTDSRHHTLERLIAATPGFELSCLPDADAAHTCYAPFSLS